MPPHFTAQRPTLPVANPHDEQDQQSHVSHTPEAGEAVSHLYQTITGTASLDAERSGEALARFTQFEKYLEHDRQARPQRVPLSVCFKSVTTYGTPGGTVKVKTLKDAVWRTLTFQDLYEWTLRPLISPTREDTGQALIRDFSGVVRNGQIMLVLGNPGSGCSTFLRTIANDHASFLGVKGTVDYAGLTPAEIAKHFRGSVAYVPEDDVHLPTLTVRQTLEYALRNKTPKRWLDQIPRFINEFGRIFGMTHVMDTMVGNEYIRGVSGGERKRVSILESLASDASVSAWDCSTRGLEAASALDYMRSLRILTDACQRATVVSLYQASDPIYHLADQVLLIDEGRMLYQGPAREAEAYFHALGFRRLPRQTMSDFLTSVTRADGALMRKGDESSVHRGAANLEQAFRASDAYVNLLREIKQYEMDLRGRNDGSESLSDSNSSILAERLKNSGQLKSKYVRHKSSYNTSTVRQLMLCAQREIWQFQGNLGTFYSKLFTVLVCAFLMGSMFYSMPDDTDGVYSRGGFCFYSAGLLAWFQISELETAFSDRAVVSRQKRYAMARPSAVVIGKTLVDVLSVTFLSVIFSLIAYFLGGMKRDSGAFFIYTTSMILCGLAYTAFYRLFGAVSPRLEVAVRYCGILVLVTMACGGYVRSVDSMLSAVPWVGWLAYLTPVLYTFEIMMATEFHGRQFPCAAGSIIPAGPGYSDAAFQSCASKGVAAGEIGLDGDAYLAGQFGFRYDNIGRNYGILFLFFVVLLAATMWLVEVVDWADGGGQALEVAGTGTPTVSKVVDEESGRGTGGGPVVVTDTNTKDRPDGLLRSKQAFTWRNLHYAVPHQGGEKELLRDVSGFCEPGRLTALVGASGAGKSTLMTVLTQQATGKVTGRMMVGCQEVQSSFGRNIGFCQQMDIHENTSTVREAFEFSALLRQGAEVPRAEKIAYVDEMIGILGMTELQHFVIRSLSPEQKKRTTIGVELCARPSFLLFLDEPTSGLDSQGAIGIVRLLRRLADAGQAIICTIHQANQEQFELFDDVLALHRGGRVYYFGETGANGATVLDYFARNGVAAAPDKNIADLLIEVASHAEGGTQRDWCAVWDRSPEAAAVLARIDRLTSFPGEEAEGPDAASHGGFASSTARQMMLLTQRTLRQYWRTPEYVYSRLYCSVLHAALNGLLFLQLGNTVGELQYRIFACFLVLMVVPEFISACAVMFEQNRAVWLGREYPSRVYGWVAFSTAQVVAEIPYALVGAVVFYLLFYFLVGLPLGEPAGYTFLMVALFHLFSTSWGQWIAALSSDAAMAASLMPFFIVMCEFFNGVLQPQRLMPAVWAYSMYYVAPFTYWIQGVVAMALPGLVVRCADSELVRFQPPPGQKCLEYAGAWLADTTGYLVDPGASSDCGYCQYAAGGDYLHTIDVTGSVAWPYLAVFLLFTVTNYAFVFLFVYAKSVRNWLPW